MAEAEPHWPLLPARGIGCSAETGKGLSAGRVDPCGWGWARWAEPVQKAADVEEEADNHE